MKRTDTKTLISALRILARDIQSEDGVANAVIAEAAERLEELEQETGDIALIAHMQGADRAKGQIDALQARVAELEAELVAQWKWDDGSILRKRRIGKLIPIEKLSA